jgi:hypothetical protein
MHAGDASGANALVTAHLPAVLERWPDATNYGLSALRKGAAIRAAAGDVKGAASLRERIERVAPVRAAPPK